MTPAKYDEYMARALLAEYVDARLFAGIPQPMRPDDEMIPGRDDLESE